MKQGKPQKAPKVPILNPKKNHMRESDVIRGNKSPMSPLTRKRLS
jgi:hypothetical protein